MKINCKQCNKKHNRVKLDLMSATKMYHLFCSDFCENAFALAKMIGQKQMASIRVSNPDQFKPGMTVTLGGDICQVEKVRGDVVEVFKYQSAH